MEQLLVEQPIEHRLSSRCLRRSQELFQRAFHMHAARALEEDRIARLRQRAHQPSGFCGILEKKRGAGPKAGTLGRVHHVTGRAAYSNEHIKPLSAA